MNLIIKLIARALFKYTYFVLRNAYRYKNAGKAYTKTTIPAIETFYEILAIYGWPDNPTAGVQEGSKIALKDFKSSQ